MAEEHVEQAMARTDEVVKGLLEHAQRDFPEGFDVGAVAVIAEINGAVYFRSSDTRRWVQVGLFREAARIAGGLAGRIFDANSVSPGSRETSSSRWFGRRQRRD